MFCPQCGHEIKDQAAFCENCGHPITDADREAAHITLESNETEQANESLVSGETVIPQEAQSSLPQEVNSSQQAADLTQVAPEQIAETTVLADAALSQTSQEVQNTSKAVGTPPIPPAQETQSVDKTQVYAQTAPAATQSYEQPVPVVPQAGAYTPAAAPQGQAQQKSGSVLPKILVGALAVVLLGVGGMSIANMVSGGSNTQTPSSDSGNSTTDTQTTNTQTPETTDSSDYLCSNGTINAAALINLDGKELTDLLKDQNYKWNSDRKWYETRRGNNLYYVSGVDDYEYDNGEISGLKANTEGTPSVSVLVVDNEDYPTLKQAFDAVTEGVVIDQYWPDDDFVVALLDGPSGRNNFSFASPDDNTDLWVVRILNEEAFSSSIAEDWLGGNYGSSAEEAWDNLLNNSDDLEDAVVDDVILTDGSNDTSDTSGAVSSQGAEYDITINTTGHIEKDWEGNDCAVVNLTFTNNSDETTSFGYAVMDKAFQNGIECDKTFLSGDEDNMYKEIRPGASIDVTVCYVVSDNSPIEIEIEEFWSLDDELIASATVTLQ